MMMLRSTVWPALLVLSLAQPVAAQRRSRSSAAPAGDAITVRGELAAVLLQSRRYPEAAREYRALLTRQPGSFTARLGLARALAWGNQPREAERELLILRAQRPGNTEVDALLRTVREDFQPLSTEAAAWVAEQPGYAPYLRALARALVREGKAASAVPQYEQLLLYDRSTTVILEAVSANIALRNNERAIQLLRGLLERIPGDSAVRHALAGTLVRTGQYDAALDTYSSLISCCSGAGLLLERAQLYLTRRDLAAAEADALASLNAAPNVGAYRLLGDLRRARGDFEGARLAYSYARTISPYDPDLIAAAAQLRRDERPIIAFVGAGYDASDWDFQSSSVGDNEGMNYTTLGARRQLDLPHGFIASIDADMRRLGGEQMTGLGAELMGFGAGLGLLREAAHGPLLGRVGGRAGLVQHNGSSMFAGAIAASGWQGPWGLSLGYAGGPAYPTLLSAGSFSPDSSAGGKPLTERTASIAIGGPVARADVVLSLQRTAISDDNRRSTVQALVRLPITSALAAVYSGTGIWFAERSDLYWDPLSYIAHAAGLELATRRPLGFSGAVRVLGGVAKTEEQVIIRRRPTVEEHNAMPLSGSADLSYRAGTHELGASVMYGSARTGSYRRFEANVYVRLSH